MLPDEVMISLASKGQNDSSGRLEHHGMWLCIHILCEIPRASTVAGSLIPMLAEISCVQFTLLPENTTRTSHELDLCQ